MIRSMVSWAGGGVVFDIKMDVKFTRRGKLVGDGQKTNALSIVT